MATPLLKTIQPVTNTVDTNRTTAASSAVFDPSKYLNAQGQLQGWSRGSGATAIDWNGMKVMPIINPVLGNVTGYSFRKPDPTSPTGWSSASTTGTSPYGTAGNSIDTSQMTWSPYDNSDGWLGPLIGTAALAGVGGSIFGPMLSGADAVGGTGLSATSGASGTGLTANLGSGLTLAAPTGTGMGLAAGTGGNIIGAGIGGSLGAATGAGLTGLGSTSSGLGMGDGAFLGDYADLAGYGAPTNPALIDSAVGSPGYGLSSAGAGGDASLGGIGAVGGAAGSSSGSLTDYIKQLLTGQGGGATGAAGGGLGNTLLNGLMGGLDKAAANPYALAALNYGFNTGALKMADMNPFIQQGGQGLLNAASGLQGKADQLFPSFMSNMNSSAQTMGQGAQALMGQGGTLSQNGQTLFNQGQSYLNPLDPQNIQAGEMAQAAQRAQDEINQAVATQSLERRGVNPNSGAFAANRFTGGVQSAANQAGAYNAGLARAQQQNAQIGQGLMGLSNSAYGLSNNAYSAAANVANAIPGMYSTGLQALGNTYGTIGNLNNAAGNLGVSATNADVNRRVNSGASTLAGIGLQGLTGIGVSQPTNINLGGGTATTGSGTTPSGGGGGLLGSLGSAIGSGLGKAAGNWLVSQI